MLQHLPEMVPVAIVGIATRLPSGAHSASDFDHDAFFNFLIRGGESYERIPRDRLNIDALHGRALGQILPEKGSFLKNLDQFDHVEFGVTAKDARGMAVGARVLLELAFLALLDSGIDYRGANIGCYMAAVSHDIFMLSGQDEAEARGTFAYGPSMIANRVSYHLDLRGPSLPLDTACSSSLTATHLAVRAISDGECEAAVVGGCQTNIRVADWLNYSQGGVLSADGKCKPFDATADGFSRGEGAVVVVLKRLDAAIRDGDKVYATILGTAINSTGGRMPVNAPDPLAQELAMHAAFKNAGRKPSDVDFVELHATGTARGDPTEANWVGRTFQRETELLVGSVKGNIGHLEITAFLASLSKVCSILQTTQIPPNVNVTRLNPAIHWDEYRMRTPTKSEKLSCRSPTGKSLIAMTSSGIGGSNGHCVVESAPPVSPESSSFWLQEPSHHLIVAGGLSPRSAGSVVDLLKEDIHTESIADLALTHGRRARGMAWRSFAVVGGASAANFAKPQLVPASPLSKIFVFSGQGPQHMLMGKELFQFCAPFRDTVLELDAVFQRATGESLVHDYGLFGDSAASKVLGDIWPIAITLPSLTVFQIALFDALVALGIKPDGLVGHSAGEVTLIYASGAGSKALALEVAIARGRAMSILEKYDGTMAAVNCAADTARNIVSSVSKELGDGSLEVACYNADEAVTLSGSVQNVELAVARAKALGLFAQRLRTRVPVHSSMMDLCETEYRAAVQEVFSRYTISNCTVPVYSSATGLPLDRPLDAEYFWQNTRGPVLFTRAVRAMASAHPHQAFVELSPHPVLSSYLQALSSPDALVASPARRPNPKRGETRVEVASFLTAVGQLAVVDCSSIDFRAVAGRHANILRQPPRYPFSNKVVPHSVLSADIDRYTQHRNGPLNYAQLRVNTLTHPGLAHHIIKGEPIMPAAGYIEMALEYGARRLWNVDFLNVIPLSASRPTAVDISLQGNAWTVKTTTSPDIGGWPTKFDKVNARGFMTMKPDSTRPRPLDIDAISSRCSPVPMKGFYEALNVFGLSYGSQYQRIEQYAANHNNGLDEVLVYIRGYTEDMKSEAPFIIHPAILDAAIHAIAHPVVSGIRDPALFALPSRVQSLVTYDALYNPSKPTVIVAHATTRSWSPDFAVWDITIADRAGNSLCSIHGLEIAKHGHRLAPIVERRFDLVNAPTEFSVEAPSKSDLVCRPEYSSTMLDPALPSQVIFTFRRGQEMCLQKDISELNELGDLSLWFVASADEHGDAAMGFTRAFRHEHPGWHVYCVIFQSDYSTPYIQRAVKQLSTYPGREVEMIVGAGGKVHVPRLQGLEAPGHGVTFDPTRAWALERGQISHILNQTPQAGEVLIDVDAISPERGPVRSFVGRRRSDNALVAGITQQPVSNVICTRTSSVLELPEALVEIYQRLPIIALVTCGLVFGSRLLRSTACELKNMTVLVVPGSPVVARSITQILRSIGVNATYVPVSQTDYEMSVLHSRTADVVLCGSEDTLIVAAARECVKPSGSIFLWNDSQEGILGILTRTPWLIADALEATVPLVTRDANQFCDIVSLPPIEVVQKVAPRALMAPASTTLFDPSRAYVLVGGVGSLGLYIALWLYQNGARHIVLTSRSGRESLVKRNETVALRILTYLENLEDVNVRVHAVDATDGQRTRDLLEQIKVPVAGCMLISALILDASFQRHSSSTYEAAFAPKVTAFRELEKILPIASMDWFIALSSVSALFGNAGQTSYASANAMLHGLTRPYRNACAVAVPFIIDSSVAYGENADKMSQLGEWGFTARELCASLEDCVLRMRDGPVEVYVPDLAWDAIAKHHGSAPFFHHLLSEDSNLQKNGNTSESLETRIQHVLDISAEDFSGDVPLTSYGLDSLSAARLAHALRPILSVTQMQLLGGLSTNDLQKRIDALSVKVETESVQEAPTKSQHALLAADPKKAMLDLRDELASGLRRDSSVAAIKCNDSCDVVFVTGTTGAIGSAILARLLSLPSVSKIYAVNRSHAGETLQQRQLRAFLHHGFEVQRDSLSKICWVEASLHESDMGISLSLLDEIRKSVTIIIHNAWPINFNAPLSFFSDALKGVRNLVKLALSSVLPRPPRFIFISSYAVLQDATLTEPALEVYSQNPLDAAGGYAEAKWVAEALVARASTMIPDFDSAVIRVGTVSGAPNGAWDPSHWAPALFKASRGLGCLPVIDKEIAWIPLADTARAISDAALNRDANGVLHLVHPKPIQWSEMLVVSSKELGVETKPFAQWVELLEAALQNDKLVKNVDLIPALKLVDFFRGARSHATRKLDANANLDAYDGLLLPRFDMRKMLAASPSLSQVPPLGSQDIRQWLTFSGLISVN